MEPLNSNSSVRLGNWPRPPKSLRLGLACLLMGLVGGCATTQMPTVSQRSDNPPVSAKPTRSDDVHTLGYLNSGTFDQALSRALADTPAGVQVRLESPVHVQDFPERLDRWLVAVQDRGGRVAQRTVDPSAGPQSRFAGTLVDFAVKLWTLGEQRRRYAAVQGYDAIVEVEKGTGRVLQVLFVPNGGASTSEPGTSDPHAPTR